MMFAIKAEVGDLTAGEFAFDATEDDVRRKAHRRGRHDLHLRQRERGRSRADRPRHRHLGTGDSQKARGPPADAVRQHRRQAASRSPGAAWGEAELKPFSDWDDGRPETELNFKFYRQATNKIVGLSDEAAAFLRGFFQPERGRRA